MDTNLNYFCYLSKNHLPNYFMGSHLDKCMFGNECCGGLALPKKKLKTALGA